MRVRMDPRHSMSNSQLWHGILVVIFTIVLHVPPTISRLVVQDGGSRDVDMRLEFEVAEGIQIGTFVGRIPTKPGFTYRFNEHLEYFIINSSTGEIRTKKLIDRESLQNPQFDIVVLASQPTYPIEVRILIKDINDCSPSFPEPQVAVSFPESAVAGTRVFLDTAEDEDSAANGVSTKYKIVDGNEDGHFRLVVTTNPSGEAPFLHLETTGKLDREAKPVYRLNISAQDDGIPPRFGFVAVNVSINDVNDCQPVFVQSQYYATLNESVDVGTLVLQVSATDNDQGENAKLSYYLSDNEEQFTIEEVTGIIRTGTTTLDCPKVCVPGQKSCPKSCVLTVFARDHGTPRQDGRAYVTITLVESNHPPVIKFRYFPPTATTASVLESAPNASVVAAISVIDMDEGPNGETKVEILTGNELNHFILESSVSFQLIRTNAILDREKVPVYNLTITAKDNGDPPCSSTAFLIIEVNNDKDPEISFAKTEYSAVLRESAPIKSYVESITATEETTRHKSPVIYSIVSGNERQWFQIDQRTGLLTTRAHLDREQQGSVRLKISARDGGPYPKYAHAQIKITILDENDEAPKFSKDVIDVSLSENAPPGTEVTTLTAVDHDQGTNGTVIYKITPQTELLYPNVFQVDSSSGKIITKTKLDRETVSNYEILIIAQDQGIPVLSSTATVQLAVKDINDNVPAFYPLEYFVTVNNDIQVGGSVGQVLALDKDLGNNGKVTYKLISPSTSTFVVEEKTGRIILRESLQKERATTFQLQISAMDGGETMSENNAIFNIFVTQPDSQPLKFTKDSYSFMITEDYGKKPMSHHPSRLVGKVETRDDTNTNQASYFIKSGDPNGIFTVDSKTGSIMAVKLIDREEKSSYTLGLFARSGDRHGSCTVTINVGDLNDEVPVWDNSMLEVHIPKNAAIGEEVVVMRAKDSDLGLNSNITYTLSVNPFNYFSIDPQTGLISLAKPITNANESRVMLEVEAKDSGEKPLSSTGNVLIHLKEVNRHSPVFDSFSYETSLLESIPVNTRFFTLEATDKDIGANAEVNYEIVDGNSADKFGIFPDGNLYVKSSLDREEMDYFALTVIARDNGTPQRSSFVNFVVHVIDENDIAPKFLNSTFTFTIAENEPEGTYVGKVIARDGDIGRNAELTYHFTSNQDRLWIDHKNGFIKTLKPFDREKLLQNTGQTYIQFEVGVHDNGVPKLSDKAQVTVHIKDVNDEAPKFSKESYQVQISEDASIGTAVVSVSATDLDDGVNGDVLYAIFNGNADENFHINSETGHITLQHPLDREKTDVYNLTIIARDLSDTMPLRSFANVDILVLDSNDCSPEFGPALIMLKEYSDATLDLTSKISKLHVIETTPVGTELVQFVANDQDLGQNGEIGFSLTSGNRHDTFKIHEKTGILYLHKPLDYEKYTKYTLSVTATDSGIPQLFTSVNLNIFVKDYNDCAPQFPSTSIVRQIQEGLSLKTPIVTVTAEDADSGENGRIRYSIRNQSPPGKHFGINPTTGTIHTLLAIDREYADTFRLTVAAEDQAIPANLRLSSEKLVTVIVEDVNDCEPKFTCLNAALVKANSEAGTEILTVTAVDLDSESNGIVTYDLIHGDTSLFELNRVTGSLRLKRMITNPQPRYHLRVRATDEAIQSQRRFSDLDIMIIGASTGSRGPGLRFDKEQYEGSISENEAIATSILTLRATVQDPSLKSDSASVEYYITNITSPEGILQNRLFDIDVKRGVLSTGALLDREIGVWIFHIEITAVLVSARGLFTTSTQVKIELLDKNDSPPFWSHQDGLHVTISENAPVGQEITTLVASDPDVTGKITYSITKGDESNKFHLEPESGILTLVDTLDRETQEEWKLTIRANDGEQYADTTMKIIVTDTNDNPPAWNQAAYSFDVEENAKEGHVIGTLLAVDRDSGVNGRVTYSILSDWGDDVFALNPNTGFVTLTGKLDYETVQHYIFVVQAQDTGVPSLSSTVTVYMNVLDLNDNPPVFESFSNPVEVSEDIPIGSKIAALPATDLDSGDNGKIMYSIVSGNVDQAYSISNNGTIYTAKKLDRETTPNYQLVVQATDRAPINRLSATTQVTVILKDVNDVAPEFVSANSITLFENAPINSVLLVVKAVDKDEGRNGYVEYTLQNERSVFSLGLVDGLLRVAGSIDREAAGNYTLKIAAKDRGDPPQSTIQELFVTVMDKNDHGPKFDSHRYSASVPENCSTGTNILQLNAFDMDEGPNSQIRYSIIAGDPNQDFSIGDDSGILRVARTLNYERKRAYTLTIQAEDAGEETRYDTAIVSITIVDVNDRSPVFVDSPYIAYVKENVLHLPQSVIRVNAHDADSPAKGLHVRYLIKDGDKEAFRINATTGEITAHKSLDRERQAEYLLTVVAMDTGTPRLTGTGTVQILVSDQNDCDPAFDHDHYEFFIPENYPVGTFMSRVYANDRDAGDNAVVTYKIQTTNPVPFEIHPQTGEIFSKGELDRETEEVYKFNVVATDSSPIFRRSSTAEVTITLLDENDNFPKFKQSSYSVKIPNNIQSGSYVFGMTATDADTGLNGEIRYFLGGPDADKFQINETTGVIKAIPALLKSGKNNLAIDVRAIDSSPKEPISSSASIKITLMNPDKFPRIRAAKQEFSFLENVSNAVVTTVESFPAPSRDSRYRRFQYHIGGGNIGNAFEVDRRSGQVRVSLNGLDYEVAQHYELWVEVSDEEEPEFRSAIPLSIAVKDVNDNSPIFEKRHYNTTIAEEEQGPKLITKVKAYDQDSGANGAVRYYLSSETLKRYANVFEMRADTGEIYAKTKLDREERDEYVLKIEAVDLGDPPRTGTATVTIHVDDINDNPMKFTRLFSVNVTENSPVGTFVIQVTSVDKDIGVNANCSYSFSDSATGKFKIDAVSGNVTVNGVLDREVQDEYLLKVSAVDGSWKAETLLTVTIEDVNDMAPEFESKSYTFHVPESEQAVAFVGQVSAIDKDKRGPNSLVTYSLKYQSEHFAMDPVSGEIFTKRAIKYNRFSPENDHYLVVTAMDSGKPPMLSEVTVLIKVVTANNHPPRFNKKPLLSPVLHTTKVGTEILQLHATDEDTDGLNAEIDYLKIGGNGSEIFDIDRQSGRVILAEEVGNYLTKTFLIHVRAVDKGIPPMSDDARILLTITGPNDHDPVFSSPNYRVIVPENEAVGTIIVTLSVTDKDSGPSGMVRFNISGGNEEERFAINSETGAVSINKELDFDTRSEFVLTIAATDLGFLRRSNEAELSIILTDVNDNPPYFEDKAYQAFIKENAALRTPILTLAAKDKDSPKNSVIRYAIVGGSGKHVFSVDPTSGVIASTQTFDYEERQDYVLDIMATNPDTNLHGTCKVEVHVVGVNEYVPRFVQPVFHFSVSESTSVGHMVGVLQATDEDAGDEGIVYYVLVGSSNDKGFHVNRNTGEITVARRLDRESQSRVVLTVLAKNQGSIRGNDTDEAQIVINVLDGNDPPVFDREEYVAELSEDSRPGSSVVTVVATDTDVRPLNNRFTYQILSENMNRTFRIDPITGIIYTISSLDREVTSSYTLTVGAIDTGSPPGIGKTTVIVNLIDVNDNPPVLKNSSLIGEILENEPPNTKIMTLQAIDVDGAGNGEPFTFTLVGGKDASKFKIDHRTGNVYSMTTFDRELTQECSILVEVSDSGKPRLRNRQEVRIRIGDKNDSPSQPRNAELLIFMRKIIPRMERLASVQPLDNDLVGRYSCRLERGSDVFAIPRQCDLYIQKLPENRVQTLSISGDDGVHAEVSYTIQAEFIFIEDSTVENSVILWAAGLEPSTFLEKFYRQFSSWLRSLFQADVLVYSAAYHSNGTNIALAAASGKRYVAAPQIAKTLISRKPEIEGLLGVPVIINFSPCSSELVCQNGGTCSHSLNLLTEHVPSYSPTLILSSPKVQLELSCLCSPEFTGKYCEHRKEPCSPNPCQEGGMCIKQLYDFSCVCPSQRQGKRCEIEKSDVCQVNPCLNGGTCKENQQSGSYFCLCRPGFFGDLCQSTTDVCKPNPCLNGGECISPTGSASSFPKCKCRAHYFGRYCEKSAFGFGSESFMTFPPLETNTNDIAITFSTLKRNSLLAYDFGEEIGGRSDFIALQLVNGKPSLSYGGATTEISAIAVNKFVADGRWYRIIATRNSRLVSLSVSACQQGGEGCEECNPGNTACYASGSGRTGTLNFVSSPLFIGGIKDIEAVLKRPGQLQSIDFVGCIQSIVVNGRSLNMSSPDGSRSIREECQRTSGICEQSSPKCGVGQCLDLWESYACNCNGIIANNCQEAFQPYSFGAGTFIEFRIGERFKRSQILTSEHFKPTFARNRRSSNSKTLSLTFRTIQSDAVLLYAASGKDYTIVELVNGEIQLVSQAGISQTIQMRKPGVFLSEGAWHTFELISDSNVLRMKLDDEAVGYDIDHAIAHDFLDPYLTELTLGGMLDGTITNKIFTGFTGCMSNFTINNENQPMNGTGGLFDEILVQGKLSRGCNSAIAGAATAPDPLSIGVTLVIVFFVFLLVSMLASFAVFRMRKREKNPLPISKGLTKPSPAGPSSGDVVRNPMVDEESSEAIRNFVRNSKKMVANNTCYQKPDIIERAVATPPQMFVNKSPLSSSMLNSSHGISLDPDLPDMPEHYDLENASSIAPSDIDIVYHYKGFRDNLGGRKASPFRHSHGFSSSHLSAGGLRQSPISNVLKSTPLARLSPSSELSQQITPRILTLQDISGKPLQSALLAANHKDTMSQSEHSLNISRSSSRSSMVNASSQSTKKKRRKYGGDSGSGINIGLTAEEIERLNNSRHKNNSSLVSTLDDLSSEESEDPRMKNNLSNLVERKPHRMRMRQHAHHTSSEEEESVNDSFSCSEFDYDNDKGFSSNHSHLMYPIAKHLHSPRPDEGEGSFQGSLSTLVASDDDLAYVNTFKSQNHPHAHTPSATAPPLRWDYLLNWGPNFSGLSGVFKDLAQLPELASELPSTSSPNTTLAPSNSIHNNNNSNHTTNPMLRPNNSNITPNRRPNEEYV